MSPSLENESHVSPLSRWPFEVIATGLVDEMFSSVSNRTAVMWLSVVSSMSPEMSQ